MITRETIAKIHDTAHVEEVVEDFVSLKKRGGNYVGLCPFHKEKTPSFSVSPAKGIYKCFGCGAGGNAISFVMEHEQYSYPEALRYLAGKYNIEIEEEEKTVEQEEEQNERENLFVVTGFAEKYFIDQLHETDEGKSIGLSYFKERGFSDEIIEKFKLGYCPEGYDHFTKTAIDSGYQPEYLITTGLTKDKNGKRYDSYRGRIIFPIHNLSGRPIGFGGRTLKSDKKIPKYINSPECDIYDKSRSLYGVYFARQSIVKNDNCYLVEGYTDVLSLHQSGIENVVASSGTSLTQEQIRLVRRYTKNITILYDGDAAGLKASFRGIDLVLEEGMNVRVVLFPDGEDPDSYAKKLEPEELEKFITQNSRDFIVFKTGLLYEGVKDDPIKKSGLIHEIVNSIALIPDHITRSLYIKECSKILDISEKALLSELNKTRRKQHFERRKKEAREDEYYPEAEHEKDLSIQETERTVAGEDCSFQEEGLLRVLLQYGDKSIQIDLLNEEDEIEKATVQVADYVVHELQNDAIQLENKVYQKILDEVSRLLQEDLPVDQQYFIRHEDEEIRKSAIDLISEKHNLHKWDKREIFVTTEDMKLNRAVISALYSFKAKRILKMIRQNQERLKNAEESDTGFEELLEHQKKLNDIKMQISAKQGRIILQ